MKNYEVFENCKSFQRISYEHVQRFAVISYYFAYCNVENFEIILISKLPSIRKIRLPLILSNVYRINLGCKFWLNCNSATCTHRVANT